MPDERAARFRAFVELSVHSAAQRADVVAGYCDQRNLEGAAGGKRTHRRQDHLARKITGRAKQDQRIGPRFVHAPAALTGCAPTLAAFAAALPPRGNNSRLGTALRRSWEEWACLRLILEG